MASHYSRLEVLGRRLRSIVDEERADAAKGLGREDPDEVIALAQSIIEESEHLPVRRDAVSAIAYTRSDSALDALLALSVNPDIDVELRAQATEGLGYVIQFKSRGHPRYDEIADALVARLDDEAPLVRLWAIQAIGVAYVKRARSRLIRLTLEDRSVVDDKCWGTVRDEARAALYALENRRDVMWPLLQRNDMDAVGEIRRRVLGYLKRKGPLTVPGEEPEEPEELTEAQQLERQIVAEAMARKDRMPIYDSKEGRFSITPDAVVYFTPNDDGGTQRERRPRWLIVAVKAASKEFPELKPLLPPMPEDGRQCEFCKGKGKVIRPWRRVGPFCDGCWGLGWTSLPFITKDTATLDQDPAAEDQD